MSKAKSAPINDKTVKKLLSVIDKGLINGTGSKPGQMCVENAVVYVMEGGANAPRNEDGFGSDDDLSDAPQCVAPYLAQEKIALNDNGLWGSDKSRGRGLRRAAIAQLGSRGGKFRFRSETYENLLNKRYQAYKTQAMWANVKELTAQQDADGLRELLRNFEDHGMIPDKINGTEDYLEAMGCLSPPSWDEDKAAHWVAEELVQVLIEMKVPGTKYLKMTKEPTFKFK
jgi:hypothetical protein